jgi:hypothetical protein
MLSFEEVFWTTTFCLRGWCKLGAKQLLVLYFVLTGIRVDPRRFQNSNLPLQGRKQKQGIITIKILCTFSRNSRAKGFTSLAGF